MVIVKNFHKLPLRIHVATIYELRLVYPLLKKTQQKNFENSAGDLRPLSVNIVAPRSLNPGYIPDRGWGQGLLSHSQLHLTFYV